MILLSLHVLLNILVFATPASDSYGFLYIPVGGRVDARDKTDVEIRQAIAREAKRVMGLKREPRVEFSVRALVSRYSDGVSVIGAVSKPGSIPYQSDMSLKVAIAQ